MVTFDKLVLLERIASGGMAEVFRAKQSGHDGFEKVVAVKRILPNFARNEEFKQLFKREVNLSAALVHPNIAHVFMNGECDGYLYLVMELVEGKNLRKLTDKAEETKRKIPFEISCFITSEFLKGLHCAHNFMDANTGKSMEIVHRDVSPQNIIVSYEGNVKLVDFGIAKATSQSHSEESNKIRGKYGYLSPEQLRGEVLDCRSDVFSAGIVLWELLTQERLFKEEDSADSLKKVETYSVPKPSSKRASLPVELDAIVLKALEKKRDDRYSSCLDFYKDLIRVMQQKMSHFIATDAASFLKEFFKEEILEEKNKRELLKLNPGLNELQELELEHDRTIISGSLENDTEASKTQSYIGLAKSNESFSSIKILKEENKSSEIKKIVPQRIPSTQKSPNWGVVVTIAFILLFGVAGIAATKYFLNGKTIKQFMTSHTTLSNEVPDNESSQELSIAEAKVNEIKKAVQPLSADDSVYVWRKYKKEVYGTLEIKSFPDAEVYVDGKRLVDEELNPIKTPIKDFQMNPGKYKIELKNSYFKLVKTIDVEIILNKLKSIEVYFDKESKK